jgi:spore coat polysaccharide biosynthesis predicted glycosyltransferase SpsG
MKIAFFYEYGKIDQIGTGHKYRSMEIGKRLKRNGHDVVYTEDDMVLTEWDVLVIDHINSKKDMIMRAKQSGTKVVLIDGHPDDTKIVDVSISAFSNDMAQYRGVKYIVIPKHTSWGWNRYRSYTKSKTVFVSVGGFDANNLAEFVLEVLDEMEINAIVTKSINHGNFKDKFSRVEIFDEENYYDAMHECVIGITNGGLTFLQALHYGLPTIAMAQYEHQQNNIDCLQHCCLPVKREKEDLITKIGWVIDNEYHRKSLYTLASHFVDGKGAERVCKLIEDLK